MIKSGTVNWLHISDLHFSEDNYSQDVVTSAFRSSLPALMGRFGKPDIIFVTGDIANKGIKSEYVLATQFFDHILEISNFNKDRLFIIPGNHDIDRKAGVGLARSLSSGQHSDDYFTGQAELIHVRERMRHFYEWYDMYFEGVRTFPRNSTVFDSVALTVNNVRARVSSVNTSTFCYSDDDHGKLWIGRRALSNAFMGSQSEQYDLRFTLMHHPFDWLAQEEKSSVQTVIEANSEIILSGDLHETAAQCVTGNLGSTIRLAAGAMYQTRRWPNTAMFCTYDRGEIVINPIRYEDTPRECWTLDTSVYPQSETYQGSIRLINIDSIPIAEFSDKEIADSPSLHSETTAEYERDLFVSPSGVRLYVNTRLMTAPHTPDSLGGSNVFSVDFNTVASDTKSYIIESRSEYGGTTFSRRLYDSLTHQRRNVHLKDARELPNYKKRLEAVLWPGGYKSGGLYTLVLDNYQVDRDEKLLTEIVNAGWYERIVIIATNRSVIPADIQYSTGPYKDFVTLYIWPISRSDIRELAQKLFDTADTVTVSNLVDKVYGDLLALCIPLTPANVVMYLRVLHREGDFRPLNRVDILGRYISELLRKPSDAYSDSFSSKNKEDVISSFVYDIYKKEKSYFTESDWHSFVARYQEEKLTEFDGKALLEELVSARIFLCINKAYYLRYSFFFEFFVGRYLASKHLELRNFLDSEEYLNVPSIVEAISGLSSDNTVLLETLTAHLQRTLTAFREEYVEVEFDPLAGAIWATSNDEEKLWSSVASAIDSGPRATGEIDQIKSSIIAEARTADQQVRYSAYKKIEYSLFVMANITTSVLKNSDDVDGSIKLRAYNLILGTHYIGYQMGCIFSKFLLTNKRFQWGGVTYTGFSDDSINWDSDEARATAMSRVIMSVSSAVVARCREDIGSHKLAAVFRTRAKIEDESELFNVMNFACILYAKGNKWEHDLEEIVSTVDRRSYWLRAMLNVLMQHLDEEVIRVRERETVKRLVALIQAKRSHNKKMPGSKLVRKMLSHLEEINHFERGKDN